MTSAVVTGPPPSHGARPFRGLRRALEARERFGVEVTPSCAAGGPWGPTLVFMQRRLSDDIINTSGGNMRKQKDEELEQYKRDIERQKRFEQKTG